MPKICYIPKKFSQANQLLLQRANVVIAEYMAQGIPMTVRQLYYQFITRDLFPDSMVNKQGKKNCGENYTRLQGLISSGRVAGVIDWDAIIDRMRGVHKNSHWTKPSEAVKSVVEGYAVDKWDNQPHYVEVWVEKDALAGVLMGPCSDLDVPFFACRGYASQTSAWDAAQRLLAKSALGKAIHIIHLGDHDPSGLDMSRDIQERLELFTGDRVHLERVALNMDQVRQYNPPPNPAKESDARYARYQAQFGDESWELDALSPTVLVDLVNRSVLKYRDQALWNESLERERRGKLTLETLSNNFPIVVDFLKEVRKSEQTRNSETRLED